MKDFSLAREKMVEGQILTAGVVSPQLLGSFGDIPREIFVPEKLKTVAYKDEDVSVAEGRFLLEPIVHAKLLQAADLQKGDIVLDVGAGTGYSSAILSPSVMTVVALESEEKLLSKAGKLWGKMGLCNIVAVQGDLVTGAQKNAPFDVIFINGAVGKIPEGLVAQLSSSGRLVTVLKPKGHVMGRAVVVRKNADGSASVKEIFDAATPYLPEFMPESSFRF